MAKKKSDEAQPEAAEKRKPTINFDYEFCKGAKIGDEVEFEGRGALVSMGVDEYDGKKTHRQTLEISKIKKKGEKEGSYDDALKQTRRAAFEKE